jgi:hypothetical protein
MLSIGAGAQTIRISGFAADVADVSAPLAVYDTDGALCSVLKMVTKESGWTFEAGLAGIMDVVYGKDVIYVYIPAGARILSVARPGAAPLRDWSIPVRLEPGRTYSMKLELVKPAPVQKPAPVVKKVTPVVKQVAPVPSVRVTEKDFSSHFMDAYTGFVADSGGFAEEYFFGLRYTYLQSRVGPYASGAIGTEGQCSFFAGAAYRLTSSDTSNLDFQLYGGVGYVTDGGLGGEAGIRIGWKSEHRLSGLDFGAGCQFWDGAVVPTVEVGFYIWGIPVACGICLVLGGL